MLEVDKTCYTLNMDGTTEKWFFSGYTEDAEAILRKEKARKWIQQWKVFPLDKVYENRNIALRKDQG